MTTKNKASLVLVLLIIAILAIGFAACSGINISTKHTVIFNIKIGGEWQVYASVRTFGNEIISFPQDPTESGSVFAGWYSTGLYTEEIHEYSFKNQTLEEDVNLYAKFVTPPSTPYTVTFETNGGSVVASRECNHGDTITADLISTTKKGNTFVGWYKDEELTQEWNMEYDRVWASRILYAKWEPSGFAITYELDGGKNDSRNPAKSMFTEGLTLYDPSRVGYTFKGWYMDSSFATPYSSTTLYDDDITVYAKWEIITYHISYDIDEADGEELVGTMPATYTVEDNPLELATAYKLGYDFVGWFVNEGDGILLDLSKIVTGDLSLTPSFKEKQYTITYVLDGGTNHPNNKPFVTYYHNTVNLEEPSKLGYDFVKWYSDAELHDEFVSGTPITNNITLYATWDLKHYTITYDLGAGVTCDTSFNSYTVLTNLDANLPKPTKTDYYFSAWYLDSGLTNRFNPETVYAEDLTLYPVFVSSELLDATKYIQVSSAKAISLSSEDIETKNICIPLESSVDVYSIKYDGEE